MKKLILSVITGLAFSFSVQSQDDDRPSWSEDLPEKVEAPDMEVLKETRKKIELDLDMSDLGRRPDVFDEEEAESEQATDAEDAKAREQKILAEKQRQAEEAKEAEERARQQRLEEQRLAAEAQARREQQLREEQQKQEQQRLAEEKARQEQERLAAEKARQEQERLAAEKARQERLAAEEKQRQRQAEQEAEAARRLELQRAEEAQRAAIAASKAAEEKENNSSTRQTETAQTQQSVTETDAPAHKTAYPWKFTHKVAPSYPVKAYRERKEGWVDVEVTIDPQGVVQDAKVVKIYRNQRVFAKPAIKAVQQWRFEPPQKYGISQPQKRRYRVEFKLQGEAALPGAVRKAAATGA